MLVFDQEATKRKHRKSVHKQLDKLIDFAEKSEFGFIVNLGLTAETKDTINAAIAAYLEYKDSELLVENTDNLSDDEMETGYYLAQKTMTVVKIAKHLEKSYECIRSRRRKLYDKTGKHDIASFIMHFLATYPTYLPPLR